MTLVSCNGRRAWEMHDAIEKGDLAEVRRLLDKGFDPNSSIVPELLGHELALCKAAKEGRANIAELLLERGARTDAEGIDCAVRSCDAGLVRALAQKAGRPALEAAGALAVAASRCDADVVRGLLAAGLPPDGGKDADGRTPIQVALELGRAENVDVLLTAGAALPASASLDALLAQAVEHDQGELVEVLVRRGAAPHDLDADYTLLGRLAYHGSAKGVAALLPGYGKRARSRAMSNAAEAGNAEVVEALLAAGADPSYEEQGKSALARAVERGSAEAAAVLVRHGAKDAERLLPDAARGSRALLEALLPGARPAALTAALTTAAQAGNEENAKLLLERGAAIEELALSRAVENDWRFLVERIPKGDRRLGARDPSGQPLAFLAVMHGHRAVLELLASKGADLDAPDREKGVTPLMASVGLEEGRAAFEALSAQRLRWDAVDADGLTALFYAVIRANEPAVKTLLARGADTNHRARGGKTPLLAALAAADQAEDPSRWKPIVAALLAAGATIDFGDQGAGHYAAQFARLGMDSRAVDAAAEKWRAGCAAKDLAACGKLGNLLAALGRNGQAEAPLRQSCEHGARRDCSALGRVMEASGRTDEAVRLWTGSCKAGDDDACTDLGVTLLELGRRDEGQRALTAPCARGHGWACTVLGTAERKAGDVASARKRFEKACSTVPQACLLLGELELQAGHRERARLMFEKACEEDVSEACERKRQLAKAQADAEDQEAQQP
jgi:ankyrin repeat protein